MAGLRGPASLPILRHCTALSAARTHGGQATRMKKLSPAVLRPAPLIAVLDDAVDTQLAIRVLLRSWGYQTLCAAGLSELRAQLIKSPQLPHLLLCEHVLQSGESGLSVIQSLRADYQQELPALLITGETSPARLREAQIKGVQLLHKPLNVLVLRETVDRLLKGH